MKFRKLGPAVAGLVAAGLALSACGSTDAGSAVSSATSAAGSVAAGATSSAGSAVAEATGGTATGGAGLVEKAAAGTLKIGIKFDQPGLGLQNPDGSFSGFDVDVATYVAKELGVEESGIEFIQTKSSEREASIENGTVDYIVATYSITDARKEKVNFAGPYFVAHQDLLVAEGSDITGPEAMSGKILCSVAGSTSAQKVKDTYAADVALQEYGTYTECVEALAGGAVDAVTTDDVILAGYAAQYPGQLKLVGKGFSDENYGIGLTKGDTAGTDAVNAAIKKMIDDGSWAAALEANVGPSGYVIPTPPTIG
ncbi:glutamate ABC transporter substrate-binding protein [Nakamurella deserti]|uniref:glutamate ABC transporter substrate-binding protein n=1 Tax=Nakamurella deserti TaxID=2164074 RepID=UPI000DBE46B8|nr:glutamate ABC transporter substrate-binding protein [Nakamurella deserti]